MAVRIITACLLVMVLGAPGCAESTDARTGEVADETQGAREVAAPRTVAAAAADQDAKPAPTTRRAARAPLQLEVDPPELDFGLVPPNADPVGTVHIHNKGTETVRIRRVKPSCTCTTINDLLGAEIPPGESIALTARMEGMPFTIAKREAIALSFDGHRDPLRVEVRIEVGYPLRVTPATLNLTSGEPSGALTVISRDGSPFTILSANGRPPKFRGFDPEAGEPRSSYVLEWDLSAELEERTLPRWWIIETDRSDCPLVDVWVRHRTTIILPKRGQRWYVRDRRVPLGLITSDDPPEFEVHVARMGLTTIEDARSLSEDFDVQLIGCVPDGENGVCTLRLTPRTEFAGVLFGSLQLVSPTGSSMFDVTGKVVR